MMLAQTCLMTSVNKSSEVHQEAELPSSFLAAYKTSKEFVSYGFTQISKPSRRGWLDSFSLDHAMCVVTSCILEVTLCTDRT